jgi:predicted nucleic acid-binding protein
LGISSGDIPTRILIDSSFLFALNSPNDKNRARVTAVSQLNIHEQFVPDIVLAETAYMLRHRIGQAAVWSFLQILSTSRLQLIGVTKSDISRAHDIMIKYKESDFDLADCCIMALSERLSITHICSFDVRDFRIFRPKHCDYLTLLP